MPSGKVDDFIERLGGYDARIRGHTLFSIPQGQVVLSCREDTRWEPYLF